MHFLTGAKSSGGYEALAYFLVMAHLESIQLCGAGRDLHDDG
jgi:hypothetical protein